jgi:hypothetical protein
MNAQEQLQQEIGKRQYAMDAIGSGNLQAWEARELFAVIDHCDTRIAHLQDVVATYPELFQ